uniref:RHS repeat-associated core domain-containing protein n=1 Tax=Burkholderia cepacia TaxID=292 RepID=UPI002AB5F5AE
SHLLALQLDERELVSYERDDLHREVARLQGNRLLQTQQWDALGRLSEQVLAHEAKGPPGQTAGGSRLLVRRYRYDASGQLTDINDTRRGQLAYRYDPVGRLLEAQSRLGHETFAFDPASNLIDPAEQREAERQRMPRIKALDNLLKQYAGTHYQYDARGNQTKRWKNGQESRFTWDLFDRLTHYEDERLQADYSYDALGRRLTKHSKAYYEERREAGPHWNRAERVKRNRELQCGFTLYGWDGDTLAWESKIADEDGFGARTTHYVYEPGSFVPVAQAVRDDAIELLDQPEYGDYYRQDEDPLWGPPPPAPPIDGLAWYQCDHLGTPQELTDEQSEIAWAAEYRAWGVAQEVIRKASGKASVANPIRFQGQYHDHETGLHYNRYRYYDPNSGRFISKDPIGLQGGINVYQYAPNPIEWVDPLGLAGNRANRRAGGILQDIDTKGGGHAYSRHGAGTTLAQQEHRAVTGISPDCPCPKRPRPSDSTRFLSNVDQLDAIQRGRALMNANGTDAVTFNMGRTIGEGYRKGGGPVLNTSEVTVFRRDGNIVTAFPQLPKL